MSELGSESSSLNLLGVKKGAQVFLREGPGLGKGSEVGWQHGVCEGPLFCFRPKAQQAGPGQRDYIAVGSHVGHGPVKYLHGKGLGCESPAQFQ